MFWNVFLELWLYCITTWIRPFIIASKPWVHTTFLFKYFRTKWQTVQSTKLINNISSIFIQRFIEQLDNYYGTCCFNYDMWINTSYNTSNYIYSCTELMYKSVTYTYISMVGRRRSILNSYTDQHQAPWENLSLRVLLR